MRRWETERREGMDAIKSVVVLLTLVAVLAAVVAVAHWFGAPAAYATAAVLILAAYLRTFRGQA